MQKVTVDSVISEDEIVDVESELKSELSEEEQAVQKIMQARQQRQQACEKEVMSVLEKHKCDLVASFVFSSNRQPQVIINVEAR